jgi:hypothetical protein
MVPECSREREGSSVRLATTGFDGTRFVVELDDEAHTATISSSAPSAILGGVDRLVLARTEDVVPPPATARRITGEERTMPITLDRPRDPARGS